MNQVTNLPKAKAGRQTFEFDYPTSALLDWDNYIRIEPLENPVTLLNVDLMLGSERVR